MANVNTFDLTIYLVGNKDLVFRGISRVALKRYINHYKTGLHFRGHHVTERKVNG